MTTDAVPAAIVPPRPAWRSLLWTVPFTVLWTWLIYSLPVLPESGLPALAVRLMVHGLIALGLWLGLERTNLTRRLHRASPRRRAERVASAERAPRSPRLVPQRRSQLGAAGSLCRSSKNVRRRAALP
jgi:hypothetical protein